MDGCVASDSDSDGDHMEGRGHSDSKKRKRQGSSSEKNAFTNKAHSLVRRHMAYYAKVLFYRIHETIIFPYIDIDANQDNKKTFIKLLKARVHGTFASPSASEKASHKVVKCLEEMIPKESVIKVKDMLRVAYALRTVNVRPGAALGKGRFEERSLGKTTDDIEEPKNKRNQVMLPLEDMYVLKLYMIYFYYTGEDKHVGYAAEVLPKEELERIGGLKPKKKSSKSNTSQSSPNPSPQLPQSSVNGMNPPSTTNQPTNGNMFQSAISPISQQSKTSSLLSGYLLPSMKLTNTPTMVAHSSSKSPHENSFSGNNKYSSSGDWENVFRFLADFRNNTFRHVISNNKLHTLQVAPFSLPYEELKSFWNMIVGVEEYILSEDLDTVTREKRKLYEVFKEQIFLPNVRFWYFSQLESEQKHDIIAGNGYCFYSTMYALSLSATNRNEKAVIPPREQFKGGKWSFTHYMNDLVEQIDEDVSFWVERLDEVKQLRDAPIDLYDNNDDAAIDTSSKLQRDALQYYEEDIRFVVNEMIGVSKNLHRTIDSSESEDRDYNNEMLLPFKYWGKSASCRFAFSERLAFPVVCFNVHPIPKLQHAVIAEIVKQHNDSVGHKKDNSIMPKFVLNPKNYVMLSFCNSKTVADNSASNGTIPYRNTSAIREWSYTYNALMDLFQSHELPQALCHESNHYFPLKDMDYPDIVKFIQLAVESICGDLFESLVSSFLSKIQVGQINLFSKSEYWRNRCHDWKEIEKDEQSFPASVISIDQEDDAIVSSLHQSFDGDSTSVEDSLNATTTTILSSSSNRAASNTNNSILAVNRRDILNSIYSDAVDSIVDRGKSYTQVEDLVQELLGAMSALTLRQKSK